MRDCYRYNRNKIDGKEITVTLEDALISLESLRFMLGGAIKRGSSATDEVIVHRSEEVVVGTSGATPLPKDHITGETLTPIATPNHPIRFINLTKGWRTQVSVESGSKSMEASGTITFKNDAMGVTSTVAAEGDRIRIFWDEIHNSDTGDNADKAVEVTISPSTFPGTYKVVGDTFMRSQKTGKDEAFQFVIEKAKVLSEVTITLEAEGDPSTFEMSLNVLRDDSGSSMMKLVRYGGASAGSSATGDDEGSISGT